jgi:hypothetical protein
VGFDSRATNLVIGDTNAQSDCFVRSLTFNTTRRVSVSTIGAQGNDRSDRIFLSSDGLAALFDSEASNFVPHDRNGFRDVFLNDCRIRVDLLTLIRGVVESGDVSSLFYSDDLRYELRGGITFSTAQSPVEMVLEAVGPDLQPARLEFAIEFHSTSPSIRQTIEMYNFDTNLYEIVDTRQSPTSDTVVVVAITSSPGRFVSAAGLMRTRLAYKATAPVFAYPWRTRIDHVRWTQF